VAAAQQKLLPAQSEVAFTSRQMGVPVDGKFKSFSAQVAFDPAKLASSSIAFTSTPAAPTSAARPTPSCPRPGSTWPLSQGHLHLQRHQAHRRHLL
jgi:hypothetical protein